MPPAIHKWINYKYPQNYLIRNPLAGAIIFTIFSFVFTVFYKPLGVKTSLVGFGLTMAAYALITGLGSILIIKLLKSIKWFRDVNDWTILKELVSIVFVLSGIGIFVYGLGFIIEPPADRLNLSTFTNSILIASMISIIPFTFFTCINYYYLFPQTIKRFDGQKDFPEKGSSGKPLIITSQLKKESLTFNPDEFIYAESDGNYVIFYLDKNNQVKKEIIRNSINSIEQQLSQIPYFIRTHRAFIVNLKKVVSKHGTTLGYRLRLEGTEKKIPVSRSNTVKFNQVFSEN